MSKAIAKVTSEGVHIIIDGEVRHKITVPYEDDRAVLALAFNDRREVSVKIVLWYLAHIFKFIVVLLPALCLYGIGVALNSVTKLGEFCFRAGNYLFEKKRK